MCWWVIAGLFKWNVYVSPTFETTALGFFKVCIKIIPPTTVLDWTLPIKSIIKALCICSSKTLLISDKNLINGCWYCYEYGGSKYGASSHIHTLYIHRQDKNKGEGQTSQSLSCLFVNWTGTLAIVKKTIIITNIVKKKKYN